MFKAAINTATDIANKKLKAAFSESANIVHDQTNLTKQSRAKKLAMVPSGYYKIAIYFPTPNIDVLHKRLDLRPGKVIPLNIVSSMIRQLQPPLYDEGFDCIING